MHRVGLALLKRLNISGSPFLGVFSKSNDTLALVAADVVESTLTSLAEGLEVPVVRMVIGGSRVVGALCALNSFGIAVSDLAGKEELAELKRIAPSSCRVMKLPGRLNAAGNNILVNDRAAMVHPDISKHAIKKLSELFQVEIVPGTVGGMSTVGSAAAVTNRGLLCHPKTTAEEQKLLQELFKVPVTVGTVNYGSPMIGACVVANSKGAAAGMNSTGIEMGRIEDAFGFLG